MNQNLNKNKRQKPAKQWLNLRQTEAKIDEQVNNMRVHSKTGRGSSPFKKSSRSPSPRGENFSPRNNNMTVEDVIRAKGLQSLNRPQTQGAATRPKRNHTY